jgi:hypothetical protein
MKDILSAIRELETELENSKPILQAIAIYDCKVTKENCIVLGYGAALLSVVKVFGEEAGPIVRWFWRSLPGPDLKLEVIPINKYGEALVIPQKSFDQLRSSFGTENLFGPRVYYLNER